MTIELMDYRGTKTTFEIGELDDIGSITISVISGDEIAEVIYKNYQTANFDSSHDRIMDFHDECYELYNSETGVNYLDDPKWKNRKSSYDF